MPPRPDAKVTGGRLAGEDMRSYMEAFADRFLKDKICYNTEVLNIRRLDFEGLQTWLVTTFNHSNGTREELSFDKIVLCTGVSHALTQQLFIPLNDTTQGCSEPLVPKTLSPAAALAAGFVGPVAHSSEFRARLNTILASANSSSSAHPATVVVIGGGKSAQE